MKNLLIVFVSLFCFSSQGQNCNDSEHSVNINDSWISCNKAQNPNSLRGESHWVLYDLGYVYRIGSTHFWNYNVVNETENGMKNITVDISLNGNDWSEVGTFQLSEATGTSNYEGIPGLNLGKTDARFVLLTAKDTWGGACAGLSEVRFDVDATVATTNLEGENYTFSLLPNPAENTITIKTERDIQEIVIISVSGQEIVRQPYGQYVDISYLPNGVYFLKAIYETNKTSTAKFIKKGN